MVLFLFVMHFPLLKLDCSLCCPFCQQYCSERREIQISCGRWGVGSSQIRPSHARRDQQRRRRWRRHDRNEKRAVSDSSFYGPRPIVLPETGGGTTHSVGGPPVLPQRNVHGERARAVGVPNSKRRGSPLRNTYPINKC